MQSELHRRQLQRRHEADPKFVLKLSRKYFLN